MSCSSVDSIKSFKAHISGATAILKLRGTQQKQTRSGALLYLYLRSLIVSMSLSCRYRVLTCPQVVRCLWNEEPVPRAVIDWNKLFEHLQSPEEQYTNQLADIYIEFAELRYHMKTKVITDPAQILEKASRIE